MRGLIADFAVMTPASLDEALRMLARDPGTWRLLSGGTDLMVLIESGTLAPRPLLNIRSIAELSRIEESPEFIAIGALTTYAGLQRNRTLRREFPLLVQAASEVGGVAIQNRGTLGGNIGNASPAADASPSLPVYDAEIAPASVRAVAGFRIATFTPTTRTRAWAPTNSAHRCACRDALTPGAAMRESWTRTLHKLSPT